MHFVGSKKQGSGVRSKEGFKKVVKIFKNTFHLFIFKLSKTGKLCSVEDCLFFHKTKWLFNKNHT